MDRTELRRCKNYEELAMKIWEQNMIETKLANEEEVYGKHEDGKILYGYYLKYKKQMENTPFDTFFWSLSRAYCKVIDKFTDEDDLVAGSISAYEILLLYFNGKYKFKYIPKDVNDFVDTIFDNPSLTNEIIFYLTGVQTRITKNKLYHKLSDNDTITPDKWYWHNHIVNEKTGNKKTNNIYIDNQYVPLDAPYRYGDENTPESNSHRILDEFYLDNNIEINDIESKLFKEDRESIYMYICNNLLTPGIKRKIDNIERGAGHHVNKQVKKKIHEHDCLNIDANGRMVFNENYNLLEKFTCTDKKGKFTLLKKIVNKKFIIDILTSLPNSVYRELIYYLNNSECYDCKVYYNSPRFEYICDKIFEVLYKQQKTVKDIYLFNEAERKEKIKEVETYIRSLEQKDGTLTNVAITKIFTKVDNLFKLNTEKKYKKSEINTKLKLEKLEMCGFIFIEVTKGSYCIV